MRSRTATLASPSVIRPPRSTIVTSSTWRVLVFRFATFSSPQSGRQYSTVANAPPPVAGVIRRRDPFLSPRPQILVLLGGGDDAEDQSDALRTSCLMRLVLTQRKSGGISFVKHLFAPEVAIPDNKTAISAIC